MIRCICDKYDPKKDKTCKNCEKELAVYQKELEQFCRKRYYYG